MLHCDVSLMFVTPADNLEEADAEEVVRVLRPKTVSNLASPSAATGTTTPTATQVGPLLEPPLHLHPGLKDGDHDGCCGDNLVQLGVLRRTGGANPSRAHKMTATWREMMASQPAACDHLEDVNDAEEEGGGGGGGS